MKPEEVWLLDEKYGGTVSAAFLADVERLNAGEPLAYVIGHIPFLNTTIALDSHPLIPRPETEFWVEKVCISYKENPPVSVLDLCAGSGCIGTAVKKQFPESLVHFAELDPNHHETIRKNMRENTGEEATVFGGDLFTEIPKGTRYDTILSNPPYIDPLLDRTESSVKAFEPHTALYGGTDGMEIIERIIVGAQDYLHEGGTLYIEHEPEQEAWIKEKGTACGYTVASYPDQYGVIRYAALRLT